MRHALGILGEMGVPWKFTNDCARNVFR